MINTYPLNHLLKPSIAVIIFLSLLLLVSGDVESNPGPSTILVSHANVRSLCPQDRTLKVDEIESILCNQRNCDIICLSETWLDESIPDSHVQIDGFQLHRRDRARRGLQRESGGVAIYARDDLPVRRRKDLEHDELEIVIIEVMSGTKRIFIGCCYRAPGANAETVNSFIDNLQSIFNSFYTNKPESFIILGDLNDRCITWNSNHTQSELGNKLLDLTTGNNLFQIIDEPTHITENSASLLDVIITDSPAYIIDSGTWPPLGDPFHCSIFCKFQLQFNREGKYKRHIFNYDQCNYDLMNAAVSAAPWNVLDIFDNVNEAEEYFTGLLTSICQDHVPNREITVRPRDKPWMNKLVKKAIRKRDKAHKRWKTLKSPVNEAAYRAARHEVNVQKYFAKLHHDQKVAEKLENPNTNSKEYWHLTKLLYGNKVKSGIPSIIDNNKVYSDSESKANLFNQHFAEKSQLPNILPGLPEFSYVTDARLDSIHMDVTDTVKILKNLNTAKANGPDNISNKILKNLAESLAHPLTKLCNMSLSSAVFPDRWKEAHVTPVFKKNDKQNKTNFRPISLLANLGKVLERFVFIVLYKYCMTHNLLTWRNSGYKLMDSTVNQLVFLCHKIYEALENGQDVCFISLDASAAFDRVWHDALLFKLKQIGITGTLLRWLENYLTNRKQRVVINGKKSEWTHISAGVPQGSILGPLLFLIYVNDIINDIESEILLFADDTCIFEPVTDPIQSINKLNRDLEKLSSWAKQWLVNFNPTKTKFLVFSKKLINQQYNPLFLDNKILDRVQTHCQLGLTFSEKMTWDDHIRDKCTSAMKRVTLLKHLSLRVPRKTKLSIYISFIRPFLEYGSVIFDNCTTVMSDALERVQRQAALTITGAYAHTDHTNLLNELGLHKLSTRRIVSKLTLLFKIINNLTPMYLRSLLPENHPTQYQTRNTGNLKLPKIKKNYFLKSFIPSAIRVWNDLNTTLKNIQDLETFKQALHQLYLPRTLYTPYIFGHTKEFINLGRIRMGLSGLNAHRKRYHFINFSTCMKCQAKKEDQLHFLIQCPAYAAPRTEMINDLSLLVPNIPVLFQGRSRRALDELLNIMIKGTGNEQTDMVIFTVVSKFIKQSERFI